MSSRHIYCLRRMRTIRIRPRRYRVHRWGSLIICCRQPLCRCLRRQKQLLRDLALPCPLSRVRCCQPQRRSRMRTTTVATVPAVPRARATGWHIGTVARTSSTCNARAIACGTTGSRTGRSRSMSTNFAAHLCVRALRKGRCAVCTAVIIENNSLL